MKTIFTFLLIIFVSLGSFAQKATSASSETTTFTSIIDTQTFSVTKIYPNPVKDFLIVEMKSSVPGNVKISLFNILGTEVKKWDPYYLSKGDQKMTLDLSFIKTGVYILKLIKSDQVTSQVIRKN